MDEIKLDLKIVETTRFIPREQKPMDKIKKNFDNKIKVMKDNMALKNEISTLVDKWIEINAQCGYYNSSFHTYTLSHIKKQEEYGYDCRIYIPYGMSFANLEKLKPILEDNLPCLFIYSKKRLQNFVEAKIITQPIKDVDYSVVKTEPYEVYLGTGYDGKPVIVSMLKFPHIIDTGATGMGKTKLIDNIATNHICNNDSSKIGLFLIQIDKADQAIYRRCRQTRAYANTVEKALAVTNYLAHEVKKRNEDMTPLIEYGLGDNLYDYNKKYPKNAYPYFYIIIDEYSSLMPDERSNDKEILQAKKRIQSNMEYISQVGRSAGCYIILGLQRSTIDKLPSFIKAMMNVTISFRQVNEKSSQIALDSDEAIYLDVREAIVKTNEKIYLKTTTLTNTMIVNLIDKYRIPEDKYSDPFEYDEWLDKSKHNKKQPPENKQAQGKIPKTQQQNFDNVNQTQEKTKEQIAEENKKKIPGWVDYKPTSPNANVIDETDPLKQLATKPSVKGGKVPR